MSHDDRPHNDLIEAHSQAPTLVGTPVSEKSLSFMDDSDARVLVPVDSTQKVNAFEHTREVYAEDDRVGSPVPLDVDIIDVPYSSNECYTTDYYLDGETPRQVVLYPLDYEKCKLIYLQVVSCVVMFTIFGMNDQTTGSLMPLLTKHYQVSELSVSYIFIMQVLGYTISALVNGKVHKMVGRRGVFLGSGALFIVFIGILSLKPYFPIYCFCFFPIGLGIGLMDSTANVLFGNFVKSKNEIMGIVHGTYGVASIVTPLVATHYDETNWNKIFYLPLAASIIGTLMSFVAFRHESGAKYNYLVEKSSLQNLQTDLGETGVGSTTTEDDDMFNGNDSISNLIRQPIIILYASYVFFYQGTQAAVGTWLFTYLLKVKDGAPKQMSWIISGFWGGLTLGRFALGPITSRCFKNEYTANKAYGVVSILSFCGMFLLSFFPFTYKFFAIIFAIFTGGAGFGLAALFPNVNVVMMEILPEKYQVESVGISISLGISGTAVIPWVCGLFVHHLGYSILPFLYVVSILGLQGIWLLYPKMIKTSKAKEVF
ncbi:hypothetical protein ACO0RG_000353 [Hanseniaspora osmophila]|uniref:Bypass of stop codon protein 6 n=1 Tax=Hanseniaspora osmophila TaxID=56408 RepID=A0A1E5R5F9_9ASCO|nr:Bypass of stop codon protein 6 [Hanseniaspora osmophila]